MDRFVRYKNQNYTTISNVFLRDARLSLKSKGLMALVMSLPDDWDFSIDGIVAIVHEGRTAVYSALNELKSFGYCVFHVVRDSRGVIQGTDYKFYETPCSSVPNVENPLVENPHAENLNVDKKGVTIDYLNNIPICNNNISASLFVNSTGDNTIDTTTSNQEKEIKEKKSFQKKEKKKKILDEFEQCWIAYRRKGSKKKAREQWEKLKDKERASVMPHIRAYVASRELVYQRDFERYLRDKVFQDVVFQGKHVVYDPNVGASDEYRPATDGQIHWNEQLQCWLFTGFDESLIFDGYEDDTRPDGAEIRMNNGRGIVRWNASSRCWEKQK